ncbi:nicotinate-nucleotide adenylyltransferase [Skermanella rosea]|uniref:nicotinate-nucleotide adenylyltransferase n=1 Tax=Skermanella rosea TaxID=1817965 RepID=UPI0019322F33|nr:nicotinate-nucleotide adenylyltransferase [Skermanella rosea]UEM02597.1 nicotinate-nucleotide adenylyltransferase [Skermanella rosea]
MRRVTLYGGRTWAGRRVGLLGGSFNPAHEGHRHISLLALKLLDLDYVWWLVSPQNPLKSTRDMASLEERLAGGRLVARHPRIVVTDVECALETRFTAETLARLHRYFPRTRFVWLMGADNLTQIPRWQNWTRIFNGTPVAVFSRPPYSLSALHGQAAQRYRCRRVGQARARGLAEMQPPAWVFFQNPLHPASATEIRKRRAQAAAAASGGQPVQ